MSSLTKDDIWTVREVADLLGRHPKTVRRMVERGELPARAWAGGLVFVKSQVEAALLGVSEPGRESEKSMKEKS